MTSLPFILWRTKNSKKSWIGLKTSVGNMNRPDTCAGLGDLLFFFFFNMFEPCLMSSQT